MIFIDLLQFFGGADGARTRARQAGAGDPRNNITHPDPPKEGVWGREFSPISNKKTRRPSSHLVHAVRTGLEPATPGVTGRYSNQTELPHQMWFPCWGCKCRHLL